MRYIDWLEQAEEDLNVAEILLRAERFFASAYYSQQAVEKGLKAYLLFLGKDPGKTHSLTELLNQIEIEGIKVPQKVKEDSMVLSPHFVISRYPDAANGVPARQYTRGIAEECARAKEVIEWVKENLH